VNSVKTEVYLMICKKFLPSRENRVNHKDLSLNVFREVTGAYSENLHYT